MGDDPPARLDDDALHAGVDRLVARDTNLAGIVARRGPPRLWAREPGFATLVHIILEQQVSLRSAEAAMERLVAAAGEISAAAIVAAGPERLIPAGLTRQKTRYLLGLSQGVLDGRLDLDALALADDHAQGQAAARRPAIRPAAGSSRNVAPPACRRGENPVAFVPRGRALTGRTARPAGER